MNFAKQSLTHSNNQEDVREILNIALAKHSSIGTGLSYAQILEIAQEFSIYPDSIESAQNQTKPSVTSGQNYKQCLKPFNIIGNKYVLNSRGNSR